MRIRLALLLTAVFVCSCHKKEAAVDPGAGSGDSNEQTTPQPVELTDALMGDFVELSKKMHNAKDNGLAVLASRGWTMQHYLKVSGTVAAGIFSAANAEASKGAATATAEFDKNIKETKERLAKAPESERADLQQQLDAMQSVRDQLQAQPVATDLDRRNAEVLKRWQARLNEIDQKK